MLFHSLISTASEEFCRIILAITAVTASISFLWTTSRGEMFSAVTSRISHFIIYRLFTNQTSHSHERILRATYSLDRYEFPLYTVIKFGFPCEYEQTSKGHFTTRFRGVTKTFLAISASSMHQNMSCEKIVCLNYVYFELLEFLNKESVRLMKY